MSRISGTTASYLNFDANISQPTTFTAAICFNANGQSQAALRYIVDHGDYTGGTNSKWYFGWGHATVPSSRQSWQIRGTDNSVRVLQYATSLGVSDPHHIACRFTSGGTWDIWLNGVKDATWGGASFTARSDGVNKLGILATHNGLAQTFNACAGEFWYWNVALNDDEMSAIAKLGAQNRFIRHDNLIMGNPIWGDHDPELDLSGNGRNLALQGTMNKADHFTVQGYTRARSELFAEEVTPPTFNPAWAQAGETHQAGVY